MRQIFIPENLPLMSYREPTDRSSRISLASAILIFTLLASVSSSAQQSPRMATDEAFEKRIRPVLVARCFKCHSALSSPVQAGLRLDSREEMLSQRNHPASIIPGDPDHSPLVQAIRWTNGATVKMPPDVRLEQDDIEVITAWVKSGAHWPQRHTAPASSEVMAKSPFWAFVVPKSPALPSVKQFTWCKSPIDRFILNGLECKHLTPAPPADRRTLLRRATFDLTGLPPTQQEIEYFLKDQSSVAYERVLDRLLASPAYGERWGRHWLDVARYADSNGVDENLVYANAWRYRDYVVRAMNQDKPIDRFFQEQLAGDLLPRNGSAQDQQDQLIATGYLSLGPKMLAEDDPIKQEEDIIDEQIDTLGKSFLGVTLACARCHDHKFDPFPQTDYYALAGIFKSTRTMLNFKNMAEWQEIPLGSVDDQSRIAAINHNIEQIRKRVETLKKSEVDTRLTDARKAASLYLKAAKDLQTTSSTPPLKAMFSDAAPSAPIDGQVIEAEQFLRGNVLKDTTNFGKGIGVLVNAGSYPNFTEYEVTARIAGTYQLDIRYASGDARPIRIFINGEQVSGSAAGEVTGGFFPASQRWFAEGLYALKSGSNRIRFERDSYFPHIDKFAYIFRPLANPTLTIESVANARHLESELLRVAVTQLKADPNLTNLKFDTPEDPDSLLSAQTRDRISQMNSEIATLEKSKPAMPRAMAVSDGLPTNMRVHLRGSYLTLGKECTRAFPAVLVTGKEPPIEAAHSGRLELAKWLTSRDNPLTSRVFVNRVWRWHFGAGLVTTPDNFGKLGERPSNQKLLDWLAIDFENGNWSLKKLQKQIMLSSTYRIASNYNAVAANIDPENRLHWHNQRRRLEAEEVRDSVLAVSGALDRTVGGTLLKFKDREYVTSTANTDPVNYSSLRRSLYLPVVRSALYDVFTAFDFGDPTVMNGDRATTTVAPQALFMMNSSIILEQTRSMAQSLITQKSLTDSQRIEQLFLSCFGRPPASRETVECLKFLHEISADYSRESTQKPDSDLVLSAWKSLCKALVSANEFVYID